MKTGIFRNGPGVALLILLFACKVDKEEFQQKLWTCNASAADPACGTDTEGEPMSCVAAYQLGGRNFCALSCDKNQPAGEGNVCLSTGRTPTGPASGAQLTSCKPDPRNPSCENPELRCLRTDLLTDTGVCMTVNTCKENSDCRDPVRSVCMGSLVHDLYGDKANLKTDSSYCLQFGCKARRTSCSPGETCMRDVLPKRLRPYDICVPNCDANRNCPPNYFCYPDLYSKSLEPVCIPGLLGLRCRSSMDCLFGDCIPTGAGYNVCSVGCNTDSECEKYDSAHGTFFCASQDGGKKYCAGARAFGGGYCNSTDDCRANETCSTIPPDGIKYCLFKCNPDLTCPSFGGVAHTCIPQLVPGADKNPDLWVCVPGSFGRPCAKQAQCIGDLTCIRENPADPRTGKCTAQCKNDDECQKGSRFTRDGFCDAAKGLCVPPLDDDVACDRSVQCESGKCINDPADPTKKKCDKTPGY